MVGDGTTTDRLAPVQVGDATSWAGVEAGESQSCGLQSDGSAWCWGANHSGQLGDAAVLLRASPALVLD
jgi:alpha-tubulin suppressor-like RCC1 family protein